MTQMHLCFCGTSCGLHGNQLDATPCSLVVSAIPCSLGKQVVTNFPDGQTEILIATGRFVSEQENTQTTI